jgi:putative oxidoreductase
MRIVYAIARVLLGLLFAVVGANLFLLFLPPPPPNTFPLHAQQFMTVMYQTHYAYLVGGAQVLAGILLVINRYVTLALVILGAMLANIFTFHITMWPQGLLPMPVVALALWVLTAWPLRGKFATLFSA